MRKAVNFLVEKRVYVLIFFILAAIVSAVLIPQVEVNSDMAKYLPDSSPTKIGINMMEDEFPDSSASVQVMLKDVPEELKTELPDRMGEIENVESVLYDEDSEQFNKDEYTLYEVHLDVAANTPESEEAVSQIKEVCLSYEPVMTGSAITNTASEIMSLISIVAVILLMIILFVMCESWVEPFLFLFSLGIAVLINMGTNVIFPHVSNITISIAVVLQLVLSMDYSIMLLNRYRQEKQNTDSKLEAMKRALCKAMVSISSSSITTIVSMLALVFMSFTIGRDIGFVLAKGVFISLLCIFTVLPALILIFDKAIVKTAKKALHIKMDKIARFEFKARKVVLVVFLALFAVTTILQTKVGISYGTAEYDEVDKVFPADNSIVVLYENDNEDAMQSVIAQWENDERFDSINAYSTTLGKEMSFRELSNAVEMDETIVAQLYFNYFSEYGQLPERTIKFSDFVLFLQTDVMNNEQFQSIITEDMMVQLAGLGDVGSAAQTGAGVMDQQLSSREMASMLSIDKDIADQLYHYYAITQGEMPEGNIPLYDFMQYILDEVAAKQPFKAYFSDDLIEQLNDAVLAMDEGKEQLVGNTYSRAILTTKLPEESEETFALLSNLNGQLEQNLEGEFYLVGNSVMAYEMSESFSGELTMITLITALAIFLVIAISFRSLSIPAILVLVIQCAVFITMSSIYLQGSSIYYLPLLIVQCLLMGATVDYGILYTTYYREARMTMDKGKAIVQALNNSIHTILTSGSILVIVTAVLGFMMASGQPAVSEILLTISRGAIFATLLVIFILPCLISVFDRFVMGKKRMQKLNENAAANLSTDTSME